MTEDATKNAEYEKRAEEREGGGRRGREEKDKRAEDKIKYKINWWFREKKYGLKYQAREKKLEQRAQS